MKLEKDKLKKIIISVIILIILVAGFFLIKLLFKSEPRSVYDVAIMARSQSSNNKEEDAKVSLKYGDVMMLKEEGIKWSRTEEVSYLILKMSLTEEEARKIASPKIRKLSKDEIKKELDQFTKGRKDIAEEEIKRFEEEIKQREETLLMREFRINMIKYFPEFKPTDLLKGQPFQEEVYTWKIVEKK